MSAAALPRLIGRDRERAALLERCRRDVPTLVVGKAGLGKTLLLQHFMDDVTRRGRAAIYLDRLWPLKPALLQLHRALGSERPTEQALKRIKRLTVPELGQEILAGLERLAPKSRPVLIIDRLEDAPASSADFLGNLSSLALIFGAAQHVKRTRLLRRFFWQFDTLTLEPLSKADAAVLAGQLAAARHLLPADPAFLLNQVVTHSNGVPLAIVEIVQRLPAGEPVSRAQVRELFVHGAGVRQIDGTPLIIFIFSAFMVLRLLARGFSDMPAYALFGALGGIGMFLRYLIIRQQARRGRA